MKRLLCCILAMLLVPVLAILAAAAEVYEFEYIEPPVMYSDSFDFVYDGGSSFYCPTIIPDGKYVIRFSFVNYNYNESVLLSSPVDLVFSFDPEYGVDTFSSVVSFNSSGVTADIFCFVGRGEALGGSIFNMDFQLGDQFVSASVSLERVGDPPGSSDIGLSSFLDSVKTGFIEYSTANLGKVIISGLVLACSPVMAWFTYRFIKRKVTKSVFKGRF